MRQGASLSNAHTRTLGPPATSISIQWPTNAFTLTRSVQRVGNVGDASNALYVR
ncbi:MAG TPA: hypothetical protein VK667_13820 [Ktedonobacteraceae bacterium]|nr:hypothetical protein [Ktedonobacteraceae bacterium]